MPNIPLQNRNFGFLKTNRILDGQKLRDHKGLPNRLLASLRKATRGGGKQTPRRKTIKANTKGENVINPYLSIMGARVAPPPLPPPTRGPRRHLDCASSA